MKSLMKIGMTAALIVLFASVILHAQRVDTVDGVRVVHNGKDGKWGKNAEISLKFVKTIGDMETDDENVLFYMPSDIGFDKEGNIYVLDSGNHRIQKFGPDGRYVATIGNAGEGPGEFQYPFSFDVDAEGYIYVSDSGNQRIQVLTPDGKDHKTIKMTKHDVGDVGLLGKDRIIMGGGGLFTFGMPGMEKEKTLPKIFKVLDFEGEVKDEFGDQHDFDDFMVNRMGNMFQFAVDGESNIYVAFNNQNRIEKYTPDGKLLWKADRDLPYTTDAPISKGGRKASSAGNVSVEAPRMNRCSDGIAVDGRGRVWIVGQKRQLREEEGVQMRVGLTMNESGKRSMNISVDSEEDIRKTDAYELEVYDPEGILLGKLPVDHFVDGIWIHNDRVYLLDKNRGMQFFEYLITE
ncbi:MAG: NHL repeat-containing protein [Candidatus Aminicenantes bacterium]|nr:NHL repeat-containing protein [Candidatus Aminicenantes bacterium]